MNIFLSILVTKVLPDFRSWSLLLDQTWTLRSIDTILEAVAWRLWHLIKPSPFVLKLSLLDSLERGKKLHADRAGLLRRRFVREGLVLGPASDRLDRDQSCRRSSGENLGELGQFGVRDLETSDEKQSQQG
jgi:hypothetical protein